MGIPKEVFYQGFEGQLIEEITRAPELFVADRRIHAKGVALPLAEVPADLVFPAGIDSTTVVDWSAYQPMRGWNRRPVFPNPTLVVTDDTLQFSQSIQAVAKNLAPTVASLVPGGLYAVRLTEEGRTDILPAQAVQNKLVSHFGPPIGQFRFLYPMESGQARRDWIGIFQIPGGVTSRGPITSR